MCITIRQFFYGFTVKNGDAAPKPPRFIRFRLTGEWKLGRFKFQCKLKAKNRQIHTLKIITYIFLYFFFSGFKEHGSHFEISIQSCSSILVLFGKTEYGYFACMPDFHAGCHLGTPDDTFYNTEKLVQAMKNKVDGITVAMALNAVADKIM